VTNKPLTAEEFAALYARFRAPIAALDCGRKCAPYNAGGAPFCCDTRHAVPTAYLAEWAYLQAQTDLWHAWEAETPAETERLRRQTPGGQALIECRGAAHCQRDFRALTCRAFPFFPYVDRAGAFLGLSYYWEYTERCWVLSHLEAVTAEYRAEFTAAFELLFERQPEERAAFRHHAGVMRRVFGRQGRAIPLLHRNGGAYKISPGTGRLRRVTAARLPRFEPYVAADELKFPDEE
jgi:hypothetical protein